MIQASLFCHPPTAETHTERDGKTPESDQVLTNELKRISQRPSRQTQHTSQGSPILSSLKQQMTPNKTQVEDATRLVSFTSGSDYFKSGRQKKGDGEAWEQEEETPTRQLEHGWQYFINLYIHDNRSKVKKPGLS